MRELAPNKRFQATLGLMRTPTAAIALTALLIFGAAMPAAGADEHAVIVHFKLSHPGFGDKRERQAFAKLEDAVAKSIKRASAGEHDGHEIGEGEFVMYCYGPDADALFAAVEPVLRASPLSRGATIVIRYGGLGARQRTVKL